MQNLNLLLKPASGSCNLKCGYCFYADVQSNRHRGNLGMMRRETVEALIGNAMKEAKQVLFGFQGGEPTLWGLDNFKFFTETVDKLNTDGVKIIYTLQTNGTMINDDWAAFFKRHNFLIGLSLDGPRQLHEANRPGSYAGAMRAAALLKKHGVEFNILSVITGESAGQVEKLYSFYKAQGFHYLQFIPCIDDFGSAKTSLTSQQYARFLKAMFDHWYRDLMADRGFSVRYFDNIVDMLMGYPPEQCSLSGTCNIQCVVESDGGVYPCDFYVLDRWKLGNVHTDSFRSMISSDLAQKFVAQSVPVPDACKACRWRQLCHCGCKRDREPLCETQPSANRFCGAYRDFFEYSYERFRKLCMQLSR